MVEVFDYLHYKDAAHKDSKPDNIIISENKWLKLLDFGKVKEDLHSRMSNRTSLLDTLPYNAPEQFNPMIDDRANATYKADCWSFSFIIYELISLKLLFTEVNELEIIIKIREYEEKDGHEDLRQLIKSLQTINPNEYITYWEINRFLFLKEFFKAYEKGNLFEF